MVWSTLYTFVKPVARGVPAEQNKMEKNILQDLEATENYTETVVAQPPATTDMAAVSV